MKKFEGKVAVITGGASGIGFGLAERAARDGMRVVLADIEQGALEEAATKLRESGAEVLAVVTDVAKLEQVEALRDQTLAKFGGVHLLCNNAGVSVGGLTWEITQDDWTWILGVNLWGVIHGIRVFVPGMVAAGEEGHVVNTASMAGLISGPMMSAYNATKHAVVGISESLHHEFGLVAPHLHCSVLCPGWVNTRIADSERNRPSDLPDAFDVKSTPNFANADSMLRQLLRSGMSPAGVADHVFQAVADERFWILTHESFKPMVTSRFDGAVRGTNPVMGSLF